MLLSKQPTCDYYLIPCYTVYIHKNINLKKLKESDEYKFGDYLWYI
jgi:hypothetical protein